MREVATPLIDAVTVLPYAAVDALLAIAAPASGSVRGRSSSCVCSVGHWPGLVGIAARSAIGMSRSRCPPSARWCHRSVADLVPAHAAAVLDALALWSTGGQLPNFAAAADAVRLARCYDGDALYWLAALAERCDPAGVLRVGQVARYPL